MAKATSTCPRPTISHGPARNVDIQKEYWYYRNTDLVGSHTCNDSTIATNYLKSILPSVSAHAQGKNSLRTERTSLAL